MRKMEWAARPNHVGGIPRRIVFMAVGSFAKAVASLFNSTSVQNADTLIRLVRSRPPGIPLITVSNHISTLDDPVMWGFKGFPSMDAKLARWVLAAEDICFKNALLSYFFRLGKCIPITRGAGIYQEHMNEALERLSDGAWLFFLLGIIVASFFSLVLERINTDKGKHCVALGINERVRSLELLLLMLHTFPEGKVSQEDSPIRRLKWGTASLIVRAPVTPIVLPIVHHGLQEVMPENMFFGRRPPFPLWNKKIKIVVGEPIEFDLSKLRQKAISSSRNLSFTRLGWPGNSPCGLDEAAQRCLFTAISEQIWAAMERLRNSLKHY